MNDHRKSVQPDCENDPAIDRNMWAREDHNASEQPEDYEYMRARNYENIVPGVKGEVPTPFSGTVEHDCEGDYQSLHENDHVYMALLDDPNNSNK